MHYQPRSQLIRDRCRINCLTDIVRGRVDCLTLHCSKIAINRINQRATQNTPLHEQHLTTILPMNLAKLQSKKPCTGSNWMPNVQNPQIKYIFHSQRICVSKKNQIKKKEEQDDWRKLTKMLIAKYHKQYRILKNHQENDQYNSSYVSHVKLLRFYLYILGNDQPIHFSQSAPNLHKPLSPWNT